MEWAVSLVGRMIILDWICPSEPTAKRQLLEGHE